MSIWRRKHSRTKVLAGLVCSSFCCLVLVIVLPFSLFTNHRTYTLVRSFTYTLGLAVRSTLTVVLCFVLLCCAVEPVKVMNRNLSRYRVRTLFCTHTPSAVLSCLVCASVNFDQYISIADSVFTIFDALFAVFGLFTVWSTQQCLGWRSPEIESLYSVPFQWYTRYDTPFSALTRQFIRFPFVRSFQWWQLLFLVFQ